MIRWLVWDDPNGLYTDERNASEDMDPLTEDEAWGVLREHLEDDYEAELRDGVPATRASAPTGYENFKRVDEKDTGNYHVQLLGDGTGRYVLRVRYTGPYASDNYADIEYEEDDITPEEAAEWFKDDTRGDFTVAQVLADQGFDDYGNYRKRAEAPRKKKRACPHRTHPPEVPTIPVTDCAPETVASAPEARTAAATPSGIFLDDPDAVFQYMAARVAAEVQEVFWVLPLSVHSELIGEPRECHRGTRDEVPVDMSDLLRPVIETNASAFVVVHPHPGMQAQPSESDKELTASIEKAVIAAFPGDVEGTTKVPLADHVIISCKRAKRGGGLVGEYSSFREGWRLHENVRVKRA